MEALQNLPARARRMGWTAEPRPGAAGCPGVARDDGEAAFAGRRCSAMRVLAGDFCDFFFFFWPLWRGRKKEKALLEISPPPPETASVLAAREGVADIQERGHVHGKGCSSVGRGASGDASEGRGRLHWRSKKTGLSYRVTARPLVVQMGRRRRDLPRGRVGEAARVRRRSRVQREGPSGRRSSCARTSLGVFGGDGIGGEWEKRPGGRNPHLSGRGQAANKHRSSDAMGEALHAAGRVARGVQGRPHGRGARTCARPVASHRRSAAARGGAP